MHRECAAAIGHARQDEDAVLAEREQTVARDRRTAGRSEDDVEWSELRMSAVRAAPTPLSLRCRIRESVTVEMGWPGSSCGRRGGSMDTTLREACAR